MLKNKIIDFYDDAAGMVAREVLEKVASAGDILTQPIPTHDELKGLHNNEFALVYVDSTQEVYRKFPVDSAASTALSAEYFSKTASQLPDQAREVAGSCLKIACIAYELEVPGFLQDYKSDGFKNFYKESGKETFSQGQEKIASEEQVYALNNMYPINDEFQIKLAERYFSIHAYELLPQERTEFASNIVKQASKLSIQVSDDVKKYSNNTEYGDYVMEQIGKRALAFDDADEHREFLNKVASAWPSTPPSVFEDTLSKFDQMTGLNRHYGKNGLKDPHSATYEKDMMKKEAEAPIWTSKNTGKSITKKEIEKVASEKSDVVKRYLGSTFADGLKKHASEVFLSVPVDAQELLAQIAKGEIK